MATGLLAACAKPYPPAPNRSSSAAVTTTEIEEKRQRRQPQVRRRERRHDGRPASTRSATRPRPIRRGSCGTTGPPTRRPSSLTSASRSKSTASRCPAPAPAKAAAPDAIALGRILLREAKVTKTGGTYEATVVREGPGNPSDSKLLHQAGPPGRRQGRPVPKASRRTRTTHRQRRARSPPNEMCVSSSATSARHGSSTGTPPRFVPSSCPSTGPATSGSDRSSSQRSDRFPGAR